MKRAIITTAAVIAIGAGAGLAAGALGSGRSTGPSVAACTREYPAWFAASAAAGHVTPAPDGCRGLSRAQVEAIAVNYLASQGK